MIVEQKAIVLADGKAFINEESNSLVIPNAASGFEVDMTCLDKYSDLSPGLLKIDVEGYEAEVLKGAQEVLRKTPALAIEIHPAAMTKFGSSVEQLLSMIDGQKYELWIQWDDAAEPMPYAANDPVTERVHLFAIPRSRNGAHETGGPLS